MGETPKTRKRESFNIELHDIVGFDKDAVQGASMPSKDGYCILINEDLSPAEQLAAFLHEMTHIWRHDFNRKNVQQIECEVRLDLLEALEIVKAECLDADLIREDKDNG